MVSATVRLRDIGTRRVPRGKKNFTMPAETAALRARSAAARGALAVA